MAAAAVQGNHPHPPDSLVDADKGHRRPPARLSESTCDHRLLHTRQCTPTILPHSSRIGRRRRPLGSLALQLDTEYRLILVESSASMRGVRRLRKPRCTATTPRCNSLEQVCTRRLDMNTCTST